MIDTQFKGGYIRSTTVLTMLLKKEFQAWTVTEKNTKTILFWCKDFLFVFVRFVENVFG